MSHSKLKLMYTEVRNNPFLITTNNPFSLWLGEFFWDAGYWGQPAS